MKRSRRGLLLLAAAGLSFGAAVSAFAAGDREDCAASAGNPDQKIASCTRAIADDAASAADRADAYNRRGVLYYDKHNYDGAIADHSEAIKLDPLSVEAYKNRGNAYYNRKDYDQAISDYNEAIKLDPNHALPSHVPAYLDRGLTYFNKRDYDRAIGDYSEAIKLLVDRELRLPPDLAQSLQGLIDPNLVIAYNRRGSAYDEKGDYDRAIQDTDRAIRLDPKYALAYNNRGRAYRGKGDNDRAIADYNEAIRLNPKFTIAYNNRGNAYRATGDLDRAIADYNEAVRLNPKYAFAYTNRGDVYRVKGDLDRAIADSDEAIRLDPKLALAYTRRGDAYRVKGDLDRAIADSDEAIRLDPKLASAYNNRGLVYRVKGDLDRAIADYNEAIRLNPKFTIAYNNRGLAYRAKGDLDRAIADYSEAITLNPKYAVAYNNRGIAYKALGRSQDAIADARMAQSTNQANQTSNAQLALNLPGTLQAITGADTEAVNAAMNRLSINLPMSVAGIDPVKRSLDGLSREPCDRQAIVNLALALEKLGRKREAANAQVSFSGACGGHVPSLKGAASILLDLSDYAGAATAASELIKLEPFDDSGYHLRAVAYDRSGSAKKAIDDYLTGLELLGNKVNLSSDIYLAVAHNYEKLGQFCDAALSVESWVALNPAHNDSSRMQTIIADYTAKGRCESPGSRAEEVFRFPPQKNVVRVPVTVNGVRGTFILDTGATFVSLKKAFAQKAKVQIDPDSTVRMHTANGIADARRGRATTVQLRSLQAKDVAVIVHDNVPGSFGDGVDGLLGMSFLSRFKVSIDAQAVKIANRNGK